MFITDPQKLTEFSTSRRIWQGMPAVERTPKGRMFAAFFSGGVTEELGSYICLLTADDEGEFGEPIAVCYAEGERCFDPNLWIDPLGRLWFSWAHMVPSCEIYTAICENPDADEIVFGEPFCLTRGAVSMLNKPTVLSTGEWLFPTALWREDYLRYYNFGFLVSLPDAAKTGGQVLKSSDNGKTFTYLGAAVAEDRSFEEHMVLECKDGSLAMYIRTNYGIAVCHSFDHGKNWTKPIDSGLKGPCSRFHIRRLKSGNVLLINHYEFTGRDHLYALLSEDDGKTFPYRLCIDERAEVSYPDCTENEDGSLIIIYDHERGCGLHSFAEVYEKAREILFCRITEEDIRAGALVDEKSYLKRVVSKLGKYEEEETTVFGEYYECYSDEQVALILAALPKETILPRVFELYRIPCTEANGVDIAAFDALVKQFETAEDIDHALLSSILSVLRRGRKEETGSGHPTVERIKDFVREHYVEDTALEAIAERFGISRYYMAHLFKAETGTTVSAFRKECKLTAAKRMLLAGTETVAEIAGKCGYCDPNYFSRIFRESEGITPIEYRRLHQS